MKVRLEVVKGDAIGTSYPLEQNSYRAVGRAGAEDTVHLSDPGDRRLDPDDIEAVESHLAKRQPPKEALDLRIGAFTRRRDVLLEDDKISRTHAMFFVDDAGVSVVDLLSTNGTLVNGEAVTDAELADGDIVNVGKTRFVVHVDS